jgi:hypothetical protein
MLSSDLTVAKTFPQNLVLARSPADIRSSRKLSRRGTAESSRLSP